MKEKKKLRAIICVAVSVMLVVGLVLSPLPEGLFSSRVKATEFNFTLSKEELGRGANIIPKSLTQDKTFMDSFIRTNSSISMSINSMFKYHDSDNLHSSISKKSGSTLTGKMLQDNWGYDPWFVEYVWDLTPEQLALLQDPSTEIVYEGNLIADKHWSISRAGNHWDCGTVSLKTFARTFMYLEAEKKANDVAQPVTYATRYFGVEDSLVFRANNSGCTCGSSAVSGSVLYLVDTSVPYVVDTYISRDKEGTEVVERYEGFKGGNTGYVVLEFSEDIRFADNKGEQIALNLDAYYMEDNTGVDSSILSAELISLEGNKLIFQFSIPEKVGGEPINAYIKGISSNQSFVNGSFDLLLFNGEGEAFSATGIKSNSMITDVAGNAIDWTRSEKSTGMIYLDSVAPQLTSITMTGNMINSSVISKDGVQAESDNSSIFAGVGDRISFVANFSEYIKGYDATNVKAILNIKDSTGNPIKLKALTSSWNSDLYNKKIKFESLTITKDMVVENYEEPIKIVGFEGLDHVTDYTGNAMVSDLSTVLIAPKQQIYLDVDAPIISTTMESDGENIFEPIAGEKGEYFTIPIILKENVTNTDYPNTSGILGQNVTFLLVTEGLSEGDVKPYMWYVDTESAIDEDAQWKSATTASTAEGSSEHTFLAVDGTIFYLHVKLDKDVDYNYSATAITNGGIYYEGSLCVTLQDYAGNTQSTSFDIKKSVDTEDPSGSISDVFELEVDYDSLRGSISTSFIVEDNYGIKDIKYYWTYTPTGGTTVTQERKSVEDLGSVLIKEMNTSTVYTFSFEENSDTGRSGSAYLTIEYVDYSGRSGSVTSNVFEYDFTKATPQTGIVTGSQNAPILQPEVTVSEPITTNSIEFRTVVFIKYGENQDGTNNYYVWDPMCNDGTQYNSQGLIADLMDGTATYGIWRSIEGTIENGVGDFSGLVGADESEISTYLKGMYGTVEFIFVTSSDFKKPITHATSYEFSAATTIVEEYRVYLGNNAEYKVEIAQIKDKNGEDAADKLNYNAGSAPAQNLDNVAITLTVNNITGKETSGVADAPGYGMKLFDATNSKVELCYYGDDKKMIGEGESIFSWRLEQYSSQTIVIPEGTATKTGWYGLKVTVCNANGIKTTETMGRFFIDVCELDVYINSYYKQYKNLAANNFSVVAKDESDLEGCAALEVGLAPNPGEGWSEESYITFGREERSDATTFGINESLKIRVYNKADKNYEDNAIWVDVTQLEWLLYFTPVHVSEFTASSYGSEEELMLPLLDGENLICYEIENTNGIIVSHEIVIYAHTECYQWELNVDYTEISTMTGGVMEVTISPNVIVDMDMTKTKFSLLNSPFGAIQSSYVFRNDIDAEFWLLDQNGNLSTRFCTVENVDGEKPTVSVPTSVYYDSEYNFNFVIQVLDADGLILADEITLTFDTDYSALLMGLTGNARKNNTAQVTMKLPVCHDKDEEGNYLPWESYDTNHYGIYRTRILSNEPNGDGRGNNLQLEIWGTWKHDAEVEEGLLDYPEGRILTITAMDENGNSSSYEREYTSYMNPDMGLYTGVMQSNGVVNHDIAIDENGYVGIYANVPLHDINGYGADKLVEGEFWDGTVVYYTTAPMILTDGYYTFNFTDLFGTSREYLLGITQFGDAGIDVVFSETDSTRENVVVYATTTLDGDTIVSIEGVTDGGTPITGIINGDDAQKASIVMTDNGKVTIRTALGKTRVITVANIDRELEPVSVVFVNSLAEALTGEETQCNEPITAYLQCEEALFGTNGATSYTFPIGSKAGDTYTFEYRDAAGNTGTLTVTLPCDIVNIDEEEPAPDVAPGVTMNIYGLRNDKYSFVTQIDHPAEDSGTIITEGFALYIAQEYKVELAIDSVRETKVVILNPGETAPATYQGATAGSTVPGVEVVGKTITITNNVIFDMYIIDENNNVTTVKNIAVESVDNKVVEVEVIYTVSENDDGETIVTATIIPASNEDPAEEIIPFDTTLLSKLVPVDIWEDGEYLYTKEIQRYYYVLEENGSYVFTYKDKYGNVGQVPVEVKGLDKSPAVVRFVEWYGTANNSTPTEGSTVVNKSITARLMLNKAITDVKLYVYTVGEGSNSLGVGNLGSLLDAGAPVQVSTTGNNIYITYEGNVDVQIVVEFTASENGEKGYYLLPKVTCIDKTAPVITLQSMDNAEDNRSKTFTFTTSEPTLLSTEISAGYVTEHTWVTYGNNTAELVFSDKAGNIVIYEITEGLVGDVDTQYLRPFYSKYENGAEKTKDPVNDLQIDVGGEIFIMLNKEAEAVLNETNIGTVIANQWTKITLPTEAGLHILKLTDVNTGDVIYQTIAAQPKDNVAPTVEFTNDVILLNEGVSVDEMISAIHSGVMITDNKDGIITEYTVTGYPAIVECGVYELQYVATDEEGNSITANRTLYIMEEGIPVVKVNGEVTIPYGTTVVQGFNIRLEIEGLGNNTDLLTIKVKKGIKTAGQMKEGAMTVEDLEFAVSEAGIYTIYIRTQDRTELVLHIYVEG